MRSGQVSQTALRVAAERLTFSRVVAPYGDPAAEEALVRDLINGTVVPPVGERMSRYLQARTRFFDTVVVRALERGVMQVVTVAAGYDGRALRYAKPGVQWFEVDHPATQRDKLERLRRLGISTGEIAFVPVDLVVTAVDAALLAAGLRPDVATLFLIEGLAVYLELPVLERLLSGIRAVAAERSGLAISLSIDRGEESVIETRSQFRAAVAAIGEPAQSTLTADQADDLFARSGWQPNQRAEGDGKLRAVGLVTAMVY